MSVVACDAVALVANSVGAVGYDAFCTVTVRVVRVSVLALDAVFAIFVFVSNIGSTVQYCFKYCC